ncbi:MAG: site-2 protease family protein [Cyanobacteria bacterium J06650_10]
MTHPSSQKPALGKSFRPALGKKFSMVWMLGNSLAYGVGLGLPILIADLQWSYDYAIHSVTAFITFGIWVGLAQWLILRRQFPLSSRWIFNAAITPLIAAILPLSLVSLSPYALLLTFITYPLTHALLQWQLLRKYFRPARGWIFVSAIAALLGSIIAITFGFVLANAYLFLWISIITALSGILYGLLYGAITIVGLHWLAKQEFVAAENAKSGLDMPPDAKSWQVTLLPTLGLFVIAILWIIVIPPLPQAAAQALPDWLIPLSIFGLLLAYIYLSILIHELGHLLFAIANGFEVQAFSVHRWIMARQGKSWKISRTNKQYAGGFVLPIPKSLKHFSQPALIAMIFGGPFASFLLFCAGAALLISPTWANNFFVWLLIAFSGISLYMAIFNILPLKLGYLRTDGRRLLDLVKNNLAGQRFSALYGINASLRQGIRPKDLSPTFIEQAIALPENSSDHVTGLLMAQGKRILTKAGY